MNTYTDELEMHQHGAEDLCEAGDRVYIQAVKDGRISRVAVQEAPCLIELGLLHPDPQDMAWLFPVRPGELVAELLRGVEGEMAEARRRTASVAGMAERLMEVEGAKVSVSGGVRVIEGVDRIREALDAALAECQEELLSVQARGVRPEEALSYALPRALNLQERGVRTRTLYNHTARHGYGLSVYLEQLAGSVQVRTLDEVPERMQLCDRTVALVSANADNTVAIEVRQPALVQYLATVFDRLWSVAVPIGEALPVMSDIEGVTHRERAIAALLANGHTDAEIAHRLGINVRTCRHHIRKLSELLGSTSRAQLGVRIAKAGLDVLPRPRATPPGDPT